MSKRIISIVILAPPKLSATAVARALKELSKKTDVFVAMGQVVEHLDHVKPIKRVPAPTPDEAQV